MNNLKIAVIGTRGFPNVQGGVERHCEELYTRLASLGAKVEVFARKGYVDENLLYKGARVTPVWAPKIKSLEAIIHTFLCSLIIIWNRRKYDIVHVHAVGPSLMVPLLRLSGLPVIMTHHGQDYNRQKWGAIAKAALRAGESLGVKGSTNVISVSQTMRKFLSETYKRNITYIPNGVTSFVNSDESTDVLNKYALREGKYLLSIARLVPEKGFHDLIDAFAKVDSDWRLVLAGGADHEDEYVRSLRAKAKSDDRVVMTGQVDSATVSQLYKHAGLFILPSYHEGLPIILLEALTHDLLCLASDIPPNREIIDEDRFVFKPGDIDAMGERISHFIENQPTMEEVASYRDRVTEKFDWNRIAGQTYDLYLKSAGKTAR